MKIKSGLTSLHKSTERRKDYSYIHSVFPTEGFLRPRTQVRWFGRKLSASDVFPSAIFNASSPLSEPPKSKSKYRVSTEEWTVNSLFPACLRSMQMCFQPFVLWQVQQLFCPSRMPRQSRGFSTQNRILTKLQNRLLEGTLDQLMRICIEGPPSSQMDFAGLCSCGDLREPAAFYELVFGAENCPPRLPAYV